MNAREGTAVSPVLCLEMPGETAAKLREMRWSGHLLGLPADWSRELQSAVQLLLSSSIPALLFWGEARILFFNDAFADNLDPESREAALAVPAAQGPLALWRRHWPWIESLFAGSTVRTPRTDEKGGVFAERAEITHVLLGDPANRYARGGLLLMNPAWGRASQSQSSVALRHNAVLEAIDEGFCVIEIELDERGGARDYRFLEVNPGFERLTGFVGAVGRRMREIAPATEAYWFDRFAEIARTGESARFENEASQIAGGRWFDVFAFRVDAPEELHVAILFSDITERKNAFAAAAEALAREREANAVLDAMSDSAPIGLAFLDRDLRFRRINSRLAEMNGLPAADHIGKRADEVLPGVEGLAEIVRRWEEILKTGEPWLDVDVLGETPAQPGVPRSWSEHFFPVRVEGEIVGLGVVVEDTTERRQVQDELAASEARFRALIELGPVGIALSEQDGTVLLANDAFLSMLGYTREELPTLNWVERTAPESIHRDREQIQSLRDGKSPVPFEKEYIRRDGTRVAALVVAQFLPGHSERLMAYAIDITDRRAAERAVRESEARLRHLIDHMAAFVSILDREGILIEIGEPALRAAGLTREEVIGRKFWECSWLTHDPAQQKQVEAMVPRGV